MDTIIIENVRCFHSLHRIPIRPITVLVGDNSSGKSTFLAMVRIAWSLARGQYQIDFNEEPFLLGAYDQIATFRGGRAGRSKSFSIGLELHFNFPAQWQPAEMENPPERVTVTGKFVPKGSQPGLETWMIDGGAYRINVDLSEDLRFEGIAPSGRLEGPTEIDSADPISLDTVARHLRLFTLFQLRVDGEPLPQLPHTTDCQVLHELASGLSRQVNARPYAFAPIRTRPQRTYDPLKDVPHPEGSHIPMILAKMHSSDPNAWKRLHEALNAFGKASGLFSTVEVRRMGRKESDPFQIRVKGPGPAFNLVDVGYGVSQVLPIIVDCIRSEDVKTFLLQQPEVHLHPRAQAELGTFLAIAAQSYGKRFIVETHSDHLVDRLRMDVRDKAIIDPKDVVILYFERNKNGVTVHPIGLDPYGNLTGVPPGYRQFFLEEEKRLLGG